MFEVIHRQEYVAKNLGKKPKLFYKIFACLTPFVFLSSLRIFVLKVCGMKIGKNVFIGRNCIIDDAFPELVTIEDDVMISVGAIIFAHDASSPKQAVSRVVIKKSVYLGVGSIVLPGVTIGEGAVVGAGAVVTRDVQPHTVVVGVPAKPIQRNKEPRLYQPGR